MSSLVSEFAMRLGGGLALALLVLPWRQIPPAYFRTMSLVILGLFVLAGVDLAFARASGLVLGIVVLAVVMAFVGTIGWGLGLVRVGQSELLVAALVPLYLHLRAWGTTDWDVPWGAIEFASWLASSFLLGSGLAAMMLGHHYLTAPAMSIDPLKRAIMMMGLALLARAGLAAASLSLQVAPGRFAQPPPGSSEILFQVMRWGPGLLAPALGTFLAWRTAVIRSTQSATGILYATMTLILLGELAAMVMTLSGGIPY
jgi:hypothetical protein